MYSNTTQSMGATKNSILASLQIQFAAMAKPAVKRDRYAAKRKRIKRLR